MYDFTDQYLNKLAHILLATYLPFNRDKTNKIKFAIFLQQTLQVSAVNCLTNENYLLSLKYTPITSSHVCHKISALFKVHHHLQDRMGLGWLFISLYKYRFFKGRFISIHLRTQSSSQNVS